MRRLLLALWAPMLLASGCAGGPASQKETADPLAGESAYGRFLAGSAALSAGQSAEAARLLETARAAGSDDPVVVERAFTAALMAGDVTGAAALASDTRTSDGVQRLGRIVAAVEALATGRVKVAEASLSTETPVYPHRAAAALLQPWVAAANGKTEESLVRPSVRGDRSVDYFGQIGQAHLFERAKRYDEAETDFKALASGDSPSDIAVAAYGAFLERRGRRTEAVELYDGALRRNSANVAMRQARARAASGRAAPRQPTLREGAAFALLGPAASMSAAKQDQFALAYVRLALRLDPQLDDAWLMAGDLLQQVGDMDAGRLAYAKVRPGAPNYAAAQIKTAWSYRNAGDKATALKVARAAAAGGDPDARRNLADLLRAEEQFEESAQILTDLIANSGAPDADLLFARGAAYERSDRWREAEADLSAALRLRPDDAEILNYLGYAWIDRGERLDEALGMVEKAVAGNPQSGAIVDSLGWAHYRLGNYARAVETLERAIELQAGDPEINNHLGDAYWQVGRKDEAVFQWRRVLTLDPDPKIRSDAEAKLKSGLGPVKKVAEQ